MFPCASMIDIQKSIRHSQDYQADICKKSPLVGISMKLIDPLQVQVRKLGDQLPPSGMYHLAPFDDDLSTDSMGRGGGFALRDNW